MIQHASRCSRPAPGVLTANPKVRSLNTALVRLAADGVRPRCGEPGAHQLFLSENPEERSLAATWCAGCPIRCECAEAGAATRANFGVWGGRDRTTRPKSTAGRGHIVTRQNGASPVAKAEIEAAGVAADTAPDTPGHRARSIRTPITNSKEN